MSEAATENNIESIYILLKNLEIKDLSETFKNCESLEQIVVPYNITIIGHESFKDCISLKKISIPSSVKLIGGFSFINCSSLAEISIPHSVTSLGDYSFYGCHSLKKIAIPLSVTYIGKYCFYDCYSLTQIIIPYSVSSINEYSFYNCSSLKQVFIPCSVKSIGDYAFYECSSIEQLSIPLGVESIGNYCFTHCRSLSQALIPSSLKSIGNCAFSECSSLYKISIPPTVQSIGNEIFRDCYNLSDYDEYGELGGGVTIFLVIFLFFSLSISFINLAILLIFACRWHSKIHPWFKYGYKSGRKVYLSLSICCISSFIVFTFLLFHALFAMILHRRRNKIIIRKKRYYFMRIINKFQNIASLVYLILFLISSISAMVASSYALKNQKSDGQNIKCMKYIFDGYQGAKDFVVNKSLTKQNDLFKWHSNMINNAYNKNGEITNYYCKKLGVPTLIFAILTLLTSFLALFFHSIPDFYFEFCPI